MADLLVNGAPAWRGGRGGPVAQAAREGVADAIARCRQVLDAGTPLAAGPAIDAAELLMQDRASRGAAVSRLRSLVKDHRTPDAAAVRAARLLLEATGRRAYRKGN